MRRQLTATLASMHDLQRLNDIREARALNALQAQREQVQIAKSQRDSHQQTVNGLQQEHLSLQSERADRRDPPPEWLKTCEEAERWLEEDIQLARRQLTEAQEQLQQQQALEHERLRDWGRLRTRSDALSDLEDEQHKALAAVQDKQDANDLDDAPSGVVSHG